VTLQGAIEYSIHLNQRREHGSKAAFLWRDLISAQKILLAHIIDLKSCDYTTTPLLETQDTIYAMAPIIRAINELGIRYKGHCVLFVDDYVKLHQVISKEPYGDWAMGSVDYLVY
jgi:hypothetical protein